MNCRSVNKLIQVASAVVKSLVVNGLEQLTSPDLLSSALERRGSSAARRKIPMATSLISPESCEMRIQKVVARTSAVHAGTELPGP